MSRRTANTGFTLIEAMIVVAIIAILAAIGYPSYTEQVAKGRRADGKAALLETAQWLERRYTMRNTYVLGGGENLPALRGSTAQYYTVRLATGADAPTATTFLLEMVPTGSMANDKCGTFTVSQTGAKDLRDQRTGVTPQECWDK